MAEGSEGFVVPIFVDDGGTIATMVNRLDALEAGANRAARAYQEAFKGKPAGEPKVPKITPTVIDEQKPGNLWERELLYLRKVREEMEQMKQLRARVGTDVGSYNVLAEITKEKLSLEAMQGPELAFRKLAIAAAKANSELKLYQENQITSTREMLNATAAVKARVSIEERMANAVAKSAQSYLATEEAVLRQEAANKQATAGLRLQLDLSNKLASARARAALAVDSAYQTESEALKKLTRAEMEKAEVDKLIDKLYRDRAKAAAYSSQAYKSEAEGLGRLSMESRVAMETAKLLEQQQQKVAKATAMLNPQVRALTKEYDLLTKQQQRSASISASFGESMAGTNQITAGFRAALAGVGMGFGIYTSGTIIAASATYTLISAFRDVIASGAEFESSMARVNAAMGLTKAQYDDLSDRAVKMANASRYSTDEIVKAYREMAMSGFTYQETVDGIDAVIAMASIGMMEFGKAADIATNVLFGFNLQAKDLTMVVDVMAKTITSSAQDLEQLGNTMSYVAPVASSFGVSLQMVAASTEVLANAGIKGSRSGTGLRRTLTALFSDSENVGKVLSSLGVTVNTMASDMDQEFLRVMRALNVATNGATSNIGALTKAVGIYAIPAFLNLVKAADGSVNSLGELAKKYDDVGGAAFEMQKRMEAALAVDWEKALAAVSAIKTELFQMYGGNLREFVQSMTSWIRSLADSKDIIRETVELLKELVKTVGEVTIAILSLSAAKGLYNFGAGAYTAAGNAVKAYKEQQAMVAAAAAVPAAAASSIIWTPGPKVAAPAAEAAAINAVADATKKAGEATTLWAASKKLLGYAFRAVPYVGTALILKDMYDIYTSLNRVVPQQTSEVNRLADAQKKLNSIMHGFKLSSANEGAAIEVAKNKQAVDDMSGNIGALQNNLVALEGQLDAALSMPKSPVADIRIKLLSKEIESLRNQLKMLLDEAKAGEDRLSSTSLVLIANERRSLESQALELERKRNEAQEVLDKINARMAQRDTTVAGSKSPNEEWAQYKRQFDQMSWLDLMKQGLSPTATFDDYLASVSPSLAKLVRELYDAETSLSKTRHESEMFNESLSKQRSSLDAAQDGLKDYGVTLKDTVTSLAQARKVSDFFTELASSIRRVREESELDNATQEEKIAIYQKNIQAYDYTRDRVKAMQGEANELVKTIEFLEAKSKLSGPEGLSDDLRKKLDAARERLSFFEAGMGWLKANEDKRLEWEKGILKSGEKIEGTTKQVNGLHDALWDLFNLPNEMDFAKTLKGQIDFAIAQADALLAKYTRLQGEYRALPSAPGGVSWGAGSAGGKGLSASEINSRYGDIISKAATKFNLDPKLIIAVIQQESGGYPGKTGKAGEQGLMQLMPGTARELGVANAFDPYENIMGGSKYLRQNLSKQGSLEWALAAYNAGPGNVRKAGGVIGNLPAGTQSYVPSVLARMGKVGDLDKQAEAQKEVNKASESAIAIDKERTKSALDLSDALLGMAKTNEMIATSIDAQVAKEQQGYSDQDLRNLLAKENELRSARLKLRGEMAELAKTPLDSLTQEQIDNRQKLIELDRQWAEQIGVMTEKRRALQEEEIKQGKLETKLYTRTPEELKSVAEGYDSAWARSRKYYMAMKDISDLEKAGYLTHTEAMLEKINADLANMDPLTKDMATNLVQAITDVATGASKSADAVDNLKKSLKNLVMEKFVVKIGIDLIGSITEPFSKGLQELGGSILKGVGSMLFSGLGALAGGMANAFGSLGVEGSGNAAKAVGSTATGLTNAASSISNIFSLGSSLLSFGQGAMAGINVLAASGTSAYMGLVSGAASAGSYSFALGAAAPFLLPIAVGIGWAISKWFSDQAPRQGAFSATTFGGPQGLEDWQNGAENYSKGGFGLMFGLSDNGSKNIDASEFKEFFDAMAKTTQTMEDFYGPEVSKKVEEALKKYSMENWTKDGVMRLSMDSDQALRDIINMISDAAAATGDEVAQILDSLLGTLSGTAEEIAKQLETAMGAVQGILKSATDLRGTEIGDAFGLTGTAAENALKLVEFAKGLIETGETAVEAAQRVIGELGSLQFALDQTATSIEGLNQTQIAQLASDLADAYGSATKLAEAQAKYFTEFFSASEQATINMRRTLETLGGAWTKLQEKMNGLVGPKAVNIVVPELKKNISESLKGGTSDLGSDIADMLKKLNISNAGSYLDLYSQFPMAEDQQKKIEEALLNALNNSDFAFGDQWKELYDKIKNGITPEELNKFLTDMIDSGQVAGLDGFRMLLNDSTSQNLFGAKVTGKTSGMTPEEANKNATAVLKAAESYSRGVASGAIERNLELEAKIQAAIDSYASELTAMGYDVTKGVFALADQIKNWAQTSFLSAAEQMAADNIKDPNAEIYARLVSGDLPKTRDEFNKLIGSINLQTEAGRTLYAELMKLVDAFDAMYDAIESFESWLGVKDDREIAKSRLDKVFHDLGLQLPSTKEALKQLYLSGKLTAEQLAILGANLEDLTAYYGNTDNWDPREDLTNATIARLQSQLDKFNEDLSKSRNIVQSASNALENLRKSATSVESYQEDIRVRARAALSMQRLPDDIDQIIQGLGNINQSDYGTYEDYMAAMLENDNLLRQIKLRAENQVSWDEKQVKLLQEQIDLQKEAILKERVELYEKIKGLEKDLADAYLKMQKMWDTGLGRLIEVNEAMGANVAAILSFLEHGTVTEPVYPPERETDKIIAAALAATKMLAVPPEPEATYKYEPVTAKEAPDNADTENQMTALIAEVHLLRVETRETQLALAATTKKQMDMMYRWEGDGLPPDREDYLRQIAYNTRSTATVSPCQ